MNLNDWSRLVGSNAVNHGFRTPHPILNAETLGVMCSNLHSEVSELWEAFRNNKLDEQCPKNVPLTNAEEELADIIIRALDTADALGIDIERAVTEKHAYNTKRPYKHGGKAA